MKSRSGYQVCESRTEEQIWGAGLQTTSGKPVWGPPLGNQSGEQFSRPDRWNRCAEQVILAGLWSQLWGAALASMSRDQICGTGVRRRCREQVLVEHVLRPGLPAAAGLQELQRNLTGELLWSPGCGSGTLPMTCIGLRAWQRTPANDQQWFPKCHSRLTPKSHAWLSRSYGGPLPASCWNLPSAVVDPHQPAMAGFWKLQCPSLASCCNLLGYMGPRAVIQI